MKEGYFEVVNFEWKMLEMEVEEMVEELDDWVIICFLFNFMVKEVDVVIDDYLDCLVNCIKIFGEKVIIIGYIDNVGGDDVNLVFGLCRVKEIRDILIVKGVNRN